mmetsp:Transcript_81846/g.162957  ORF Transcript_81846/g.162957 Transcript_81846/m.162957 type:complete len:219 (+) Transcript_81846:711-1367(+)
MRGGEGRYRGGEVGRSLMPQVRRTLPEESDVEGWTEADGVGKQSAFANPNGCLGVEADELEENVAKRGQHVTRRKEEEPHAALRAEPSGLRQAAKRRLSRIDREEEEHAVEDAERLVDVHSELGGGQCEQHLAHGPLVDNSEQPNCQEQRKHQHRLGNLSGGGVAAVAADEPRRVVEHAAKDVRSARVRAIVRDRHAHEDEDDENTEQVDSAGGNEEP